MGGGEGAAERDRGGEMNARTEEGRRGDGVDTMQNDDKWESGEWEKRNEGDACVFSAEPVREEPEKRRKKQGVCESSGSSKQLSINSINTSSVRSFSSSKGIGGTA